MGHKQASALWRPKRIVQGASTPFSIHSIREAPSLEGTNGLEHFGTRNAVFRGSTP